MTYLLLFYFHNDPEYSRYGCGTPLKRSITIIERTAFILAFWDDSSKGTKYVIADWEKRNIPIQVYLFDR